MNELSAITTNFQISGEVDDITIFGDGFINTTYKVRLKNSPKEYVLQKINHYIFKNIDLLQDNIKRLYNVLGG